MPSASHLLASILQCAIRLIRNIIGLKYSFLHCEDAQSLHLTFSMRILQDFVQKKIRDLSILLLEIRPGAKEPSVIPMSVFGKMKVGKLQITILDRCFYPRLRRYQKEKGSCLCFSHRACLRKLWGRLPDFVVSYFHRLRCIKLLTSQLCDLAYIRRL